MVTTQQPASGRRALVAGGLALLVGAAVLAGATGAATGSPSQLTVSPVVEGSAKSVDYLGQVEVVRVPGARTSNTLEGVVFNDADRDARRERGEGGLEGVAVSNGREVVLTDEDGRYELPAFENMTVFITKPAGYDTPVDETNFPQFFYHHLPEGTPEDLLYGGLRSSGPLPQAVNFPLSADPAADDEVNCAMVGDTQTYSNREVGYLRDGVVEDLAERDDLDECGALLLGDVAGDDLGLYPHIKDTMSLAGVPIRAVPGNHDIDFDATTDEHSFDTYRREIGPEYYSYDVGDVHIVGLDNVRYPCTPTEDNADGEHAFCDDPANHPTYNGVIGDEQLTWLANDLAQVPDDKLIVVATHIPLVSFIDSTSNKHQTNDATELYDLLEGRPAVSVSGHTHTLENLVPGEYYEGWQDAVGVGRLPFPHVVAGAASGGWWGGDLDGDGIPMSFTREGDAGGYAVFEFDDATFSNTYDTTAFDDDQTMALSLNTPHFRQWAETLTAWSAATPDDNESATAETPPVNINDLGDPDLVTTDELGDSWLVANVWNGSKDTEVSVQIDDADPVTATRTQSGEGEARLEGLEYGDPFALERQLQVARHAFASTSGDPRAQGYERFRGNRFGVADPRPQDSGARQSSHLWRLNLPEDLAEGPHTATVRTTDPVSGESRWTLAFEVVDERPPMYFRTDVFEGTSR